MRKNNAENKVLLTSGIIRCFIRSYDFQKWHFIHRGKVMHSYNLQGENSEYLFDEGRPMTDKPLALELHIELELKVLVEGTFSGLLLP